MKYIQTYERHKKGDPDKRPTFPVEGKYVILSDGSKGKIMCVNKNFDINGFTVKSYAIRIFDGPQFNGKNGNQNVHSYDISDIKFNTWNIEDLEVGKDTIKYNL